MTSKTASFHLLLPFVEFKYWAEWAHGSRDQILDCDLILHILCYEVLHRTLLTSSCFQMGWKQFCVFDNLLFFSSSIYLFSILSDLLASLASFVSEFHRPFNQYGCYPSLVAQVIPCSYYVRSEGQQLYTFFYSLHKYVILVICIAALWAFSSSTISFWIWGDQNCQNY